jgi:acetyl/propionyl-CoA carboxylase alpha subunit
MQRALREYEVVGIKTTVPFFRWMLEQPDFVEGRFHTAYLDEVLRSRAGEPFTSVDEERVEVAVIAAAIHLMTASTNPRTSEPANRPEPPSAWKARARAEGLRG